MIKAKIITGLLKIRSVLSTVASILVAIIVIPILYVYFNFFVYRSPYNRPVYTFMPPIRLEFHKCNRCSSYDGGVYGKGPLEHFRSKQASTCKHDWQKISKNDFIIGVKKEFNVDLISQDSPTWHIDTDQADG